MGTICHFIGVCKVSEHVHIVMSKCIVFNPHSYIFDHYIDSSINRCIEYEISIYRKNRPAFKDFI